MNVRLLLMLSPLALIPMAHAQTGATPLDPLFACRGIADEAARLECLDTAVETLWDETQAGEVMAVDRAQIEAAEEATFGLAIPNFSLPSLGGDNVQLAEAANSDAHSPDRVVTRSDGGTIERIEGLAVARLEIRRDGDVEVELANGQVWQQVDGVHVQGARRGATEGMTAAIRGGALGSYFIQLSNGGRWFRAQRTR